MYFIMLFMCINRTLIEMNFNQSCTLCRLLMFELVITLIVSSWRRTLTTGRPWVRSRSQKGRVSSLRSSSSGVNWSNSIKVNQTINI